MIDLIFRARVGHSCMAKKIGHAGFYWATCSPPGLTLPTSDFSDLVQKVKILCCISSQDLSSEERFHVELHFSPGVKGVEEEENAPTGFGFRPASAEVARQVESLGSRWSVCVLLRRAAAFLSLSCSGSERAETDRPRQLGRPLQRRDGPRCASVGTHQHSEEVAADSQS